MKSLTDVWNGIPFLCSLQFLAVHTPSIASGRVENSREHGISMTFTNSRLLQVHSGSHTCSASHHLLVFLLQHSFLTLISLAALTEQKEMSLTMVIITPLLLIGTSQMKVKILINILLYYCNVLLYEKPFFPSSCYHKSVIQLPAGKTLSLNCLGS